MVPEIILVEDTIEDEMLSLRGIAKSGIECKVTVLRDGEAAISHLLGMRTAPALIALDYKLPKFDGLEVLERLRKYEVTRFAPVVMFSGSIKGQKLLDCYRAGANSCVSKPMDLHEYEDRLSSISRYWLHVNEGHSAAGDRHNSLISLGF